MKNIRFRSRLMTLLAVGLMTLGVITAGHAGADESQKGTCILLSARLVGSTGGRYHAYNLRVRLISGSGDKERIVATVSNQYHREYLIGATVAAHSSATRTTKVAAPHGSTFRVTRCTWAGA